MPGTPGGPLEFQSSASGSDLSPARGLSSRPPFAEIRHRLRPGHGRRGYEDTPLWFSFERTGTGSADDSTGVSVAVDSPNGDGWNRYFERAPGWEDPEGDGTCRCGTDRPYVRQVNATTRLV